MTDSEMIDLVWANAVVPKAFEQTTSGTPGDLFLSGQNPTEPGLPVDDGLEIRDTCSETALGPSQAPGWGQYIEMAENIRSALTQGPAKTILLDDPCWASETVEGERDFPAYLATSSSSSQKTHRDTSSPLVWSYLNDQVIDRRFREAYLSSLTRKSRSTAAWRPPSTAQRVQRTSKQNTVPGGQIFPETNDEQRPCKRELSDGRLLWRHLDANTTEVRCSKEGCSKTFTIPFLDDWQCERLRLFPCKRSHFKSLGNESEAKVIGTDWKRFTLIPCKRCEDLGTHLTTLNSGTWRRACQTWYHRHKEQPCPPDSDSDSSEEDRSKKAQLKSELKQTSKQKSKPKSKSELQSRGQTSSQKAKSLTGENRAEPGKRCQRVRGGRGKGAVRK